VLLKRAATLDGSISNEDGSPLKITTHRQDIWSHIHLRSTVDALCVGRETVRTDNPRLTVRHVSGTRAQPWRVILDPSLRISLSAHVVSDEHLHRTIVVYDSHEASNTQSTHEQLCERGVRTIDIPRKGDTFHWTSLWKRLTTPSHNFPGITSLLVEGGEQTWKAFRHAGMVDMEVFLSEKDGQNGVQTVSESHADMHTCVMS
jgi:diaminohydroxyphosphoribosylaminopyrimidine deaminase / 5-amino-6-(5-phosphoribosylamino)uracil reductase